VTKLYEVIHKYCKSDDDYRKRIKEKNNFKSQAKQNNNSLHIPSSNNFERRPFAPHNQVNQIENDTTASKSNFTSPNHFNQQSQYHERTFERSSFTQRGRGRGRTPLKLEGMYCIIHGKGSGHTSKMCPKVMKSIEETQDENGAASQLKVVNNIIQET
jgi:hypothetical protein